MCWFLQILQNHLQDEIIRFIAASNSSSRENSRLVTADIAVFVFVIVYVCESLFRTFYIQWFVTDFQPCYILLNSF